MTPPGAPPGLRRLEGARAANLYKEVLTRFLLEFFYPHDSERECDTTIGSFGHQSEITREQLSLPLTGQISWSIVSSPLRVRHPTL